MILFLQTLRKMKEYELKLAEADGEDVIGASPAMAGPARAAANQDAPQAVKSGATAQAAESDGSASDVTVS